jgi:phosphoribosylanthranilate isomerase
MLKLKICGVKDALNYKELIPLNPEFIGLNFYKKSPRYVGEEKRFLKNETTALTGVFVDEGVEIIQQIAKYHDLDYLQLHGNETADYCRQLKDSGYKIIKVFRVGGDFDFTLLEPYLEYCHYFLFDTAGRQPGGNGKVFNWELLNYYPYKKPYFLAGGLSPDNMHEVLQLDLPQLFALDINSGFEDEPGIKNIEKVKELKELLTTNDRN